MKIIRFFNPYITTLALSSIICGQNLIAASITNRDDVERHPAMLRVQRYLQLIANQKFSEAVELIDADSLREMKKDYIKRIRNPKLPAMESERLARAVGQADEEGIEKMTDEEFYLKYNQDLQQRNNVTPEAVERIKQTLTLVGLGVMEERSDLAHVLVRGSHHVFKNKYEYLELVSLVKRKDTWYITFGEQQPKITPLDENGLPITPAQELPLATETPSAPIKENAVPTTEEFLKANEEIPTAKPVTEPAAAIEKTSADDASPSERTKTNRPGSSPAKKSVPSSKKKLVSPAAAKPAKNIKSAKSAPAANKKKS